MTPTARIAVTIALVWPAIFWTELASARETGDEAFSVSEDERRGGVVGVVSPPGDSAGDGRWTDFEIVGGNDSGAFAIDATTGELSVANPAAIDFEKRSEFELTVRARLAIDGDQALRSFAADLLSSGADAEVVGELLSRTESRSVRVNVVDANERPRLPSQTVTLILDSESDREVGQLELFDPDADDVHDFSVIGGDEEGLVVLAPTTGAISIDPEAEMHSDRRLIPLTVRVVDRAGLSDATTVYVRVVQLPGPTTIPARDEIASEAVVVAEDSIASETSEEVLEPTPDEPVVDAAVPPETAVVPEEAASLPVGSEVDASPAAEERPSSPVVADDAEGPGDVASEAGPVAAVQGSQSGWMQTAVYVLLCCGAIGVIAYLRMRRRRTRKDWDALAKGVSSEQQRGISTAALAETVSDPHSEQAVAGDVVPPQRPTAPLQFPTPEQLAASETVEAGEESDALERVVDEERSESELAVAAGRETVAELDVSEGAESATGEQFASDDLVSDDVAVEDLATDEQIEQVNTLVDAELFAESPALSERTDEAVSVECSADRVEIDSEVVEEERFEVEADETSDIAEDVEEDASGEQAADPVELAALQEAEAALAERESPLEEDPSVDSLRRELSDLFGVSVDELEARSERVQADDAEEQTPEVDEIPATEGSDAGFAETEAESVYGAEYPAVEAGGGEGEVVVDASVEDEPSTVDRPESEFSATGLESSRYLEQFGSTSVEGMTSMQAVATTVAPEVVAAEAVEEVEAVAVATEVESPAVAEASVVQQSTSSRVDKSAVREEITSLRDLANQHARGILAKHEKKNKIRDRLFLSGILTGVLCVAGMSLMASAVNGTGQWVGWGMLACGAVVFAMCLHTFQRLTDNDRSAAAAAAAKGELTGNAQVSAEGAPVNGEGSVSSSVESASAAVGVAQGGEPVRAQPAPADGRV